MFRGIFILLIAIHARGDFPQLDIQQRYFDFRGGGSAVALEGRLGFRAAGLTLTIYDLTDPRVPAALGAVQIANSCLGICVRNGRAYLALGQAGIQIVDVSDPTQPRLLGSFDTPGSAQEVAVIPGQIACVADGVAGLQIIEISDESQPAALRAFPTATACEFALADGSTVFAGSSDRLTLVSLADPANPTLISSTPLPAGAAMKGLAKIDAQLLAATGTTGLIWYDVSSDPSFPRETGRIEKNCDGVLAHNRMAFASFVNEPGIVYDFTNPIAPSEIGRVGLPTGKAVFSGHLFYTAVYGYIFECQLANPQMFASAGTPGSAMKIRANGGRAYVADHSGLAIYDLTSPPTPAFLGQFPRQTTLGVAVAGQHAFLAAGDGLTIVDVTNPASPQFAANIPNPINAEDVVIENARAFVRSRAALAIVDISVPSTPRSLGLYEAPNSAMKVLRGGATIFVAEDSTLRVIDASNPAAPTPTASFAGRSGTYAIDIAGHYLYTANAISGLFIYDIADLANVRLVRRLWAAMSSGAWDVIVKGNIAYVARTGAGVAVLDITNPEQPREVGHNNALSFVWTLHASEEWLFAAGQSSGFGVYNEYRPQSGDLVLQSLSSAPGEFAFRVTGPPGRRGTISRSETVEGPSSAIPFELGPGAVDIFETLSADRNAFFRAESR